MYKIGEKIATREAYGKTLELLGETNPNIVVLDADLSASTQTKLFAKKFPNRFFNVGVSEQDLIGEAAGLALAGMIPFASTFAIFAAGRGWEMVRQSVAYPRLNVRIAASHGGVTVGEDGASHQMIEDIAIMRAIPNMTVIVPADATETELVIRALVKYQGPAYLRLGRPKVPVLFDEKYSFEIGKGNILKKGKGVAIIAAGVMVAPALKAHAILLKNGMNVTVVNMASVKPIDAELLNTLAKDHLYFVTVEEHNIVGGLGGAVAEVLSGALPRRVVRMGVPDVFGESGPAEELLKKFDLTAEGIVKSVMSLRGSP